MPTREELLHSSLRLLARDQRDVTTAFNTWNASENVREHASVGPIIASASRRLDRDKDRLFLLWQSYKIDADAWSDSTELSETSTPNVHEDSDDAHLSPTLPLSEHLQHAARALEHLSTRYASVYSLAAAVMEPPIASMARSNLVAMRQLTSQIVGVLPIVTLQAVRTAHPTLPVNLTSGLRAQALLHRLWAPDGAADDSDEETHLVANHADSSPPSSKK